MHGKTIQKSLNDPANHNAVVTHLKPDILEYEVKSMQTLGSITTNKASGRDWIPANPFQTLEDNAVKVLHLICQQICTRADSLEKTLILGKIESKRRGQEVEVVGWHHWLNGHGFEQALGDSERLGCPACCSSQGHKGLDMTEQLNSNRSDKTASKDSCFPGRILPPLAY